MFTFCSLQGAQSESLASQSLLELDGGVKVLVDLGWDESFDVAKLEELEKQIPTLSLILLTHATASHLAAYAHCCKHMPLFTRIPVYATRPVIDLGRTLTQDLYSSTPAAATTIPPAALSESGVGAPTAARRRRDDLLLQAPTPDEIARYFSLIQPLKYSQPHQPLPSPFSPPLNGLTITAYNAGHTLGGTIWHIQHGLESVVYAVDWNQARENVFAGAAWLGGAGGGGAQVIEQLRKPTALVCSSRGAARNAQAGGRTRRDEQLLGAVRAAVARGGTVLIPVDSSARVLELAYLLEHAWRADAVADGGGALKAAKLYLAGRNMSSTMRYARSMLEWMDDSIVQEFEAFAEGQKKTNGASDKKVGGPFDFRFMRLLDRKAQIAKLLTTIVNNGESQGRVILASDTSMDWGFSKDLLRGLAADPNNVVILTDKPGMAQENGPSIARTLWSLWKERKDGVTTERTTSGDTIEYVNAGSYDLEFRDAKREPLEGDELTLYQQWLATQRQLQATQQTVGTDGMEASADVVDDVSSDSSSDSENEDGQQQGKALTVSATLGQVGRKNVVLKDEDLGISILIKKKGIYDFDSRGKRGRERSFPVAVRRKRNDDFGELIRPEDYLRAEEKEEDTVDGPNTAADDENLGKKRKWDDVHGTGANKKQQISRGAAAPGGAFAGDGGEDGNATGRQDGFEPDELDDAVDEEEHQQLDGPCKLAHTTETLTVRLRIAYVDLSGLHDKRSLNMLIPLIQPRKLILVGGTREETLALAQDCRAILGGDAAANGSGEKGSGADVYTPEVGAIVDASVDTSAWVVKLADSLVKKLKWQNVRGLSIVTVSGQLFAAAAAAAATADEDEDDDAANKRQKTSDSSLALTTTTHALTTTARTCGARCKAPGTRPSFAARACWSSMGRWCALHEVKRAIYDNLAVVAGA
ncbi:Beta-Casp domain protein [Cordyceps fumosorosea ARSEF 2679]|uniref:Cleavage and polyadenylation specificity factor subunit 2 n=1 Tax=Cordyceps fumosorosea (strain ARSEF 2679) TaxID=1081104 RepID=A0A162MS52_CORFA|nr:Beta-Casp domain protein [Cordyceps fumosorosea ARSEF 2679]OAA66060.1 Beta-Casp domain protein [Cordyceps fumosorosea ARSEF 2679]